MGVDMSENTNSLQPEKGISPDGVDLDQMMNHSRWRILIIDDEPDTVSLLKLLFVRHGFDVAGCDSGAEALNRLAEINPSLVILDLMMPDMDGWQTYENLRQLSDVPVVVISALGQSESIVRALQSGADDYITKPFNSDEVIARVKNVLRHTESKMNNRRMGFPDIQLVLDLDTQEILFHEKRIQLTGKMFEVLVILAKRAPHLVSYDDLTTEIWNESSTSARNRLKYLVYLLRQELKDVDRREVIKNVDRLGYKLITTYDQN